MPRRTFTSEEASQAARLANQVRREKAKLRGPLVLPDFTSVEQVQAALELAARAGALGTLAAGQVNALSKACDIWLKAEGHRTDVIRIKAMERRIAELEAELAAARREPWRGTGS